MTTCYRAKQTSLNKWLQRLDWNPGSTEAVFKTHVAGQFGVSESDVTVVTTDWTGTQRDTAVSELAAGTHEGLAVVAATPAPVTPSGRDFLRKGFVPNITGAGTSAKLDRLATITITNGDRAIADIIHVCNVYETLSSADVTWIRKLWGKKKAPADGGFSTTEVTAIEAAGPTYGITLP